MHFHADVHTVEYCTYIHLHRCLHTCTQTQIHLLFLSFLPVSNPLAFHKDELWSLCYGYREPQEHLKLIWFYSTNICAQLPEGPCHSHFLKWKSQVLVSSTLPEEEESRNLSAGETEGQILYCIMFSKIIHPPKTAGCPLIKGYLILYLRHPVGRDTAFWRSSDLVNFPLGSFMESLYQRHTRKQAKPIVVKSSRKTLPNSSFKASIQLFLRWWSLTLTVDPDECCFTHKGLSSVRLSGLPKVR